MSVLFQEAVIEGGHSHRLDASIRDDLVRHNIEMDKWYTCTVLHGWKKRNPAILFYDFGDDIVMNIERDVIDNYEFFIRDVMRCIQGPAVGTRGEVTHVG